jgi:hypothetical protein
MAVMNMRILYSADVSAGDGFFTRIILKKLQYRNTATTLTAYTIHYTLLQMDSF